MSPADPSADRLAGRPASPAAVAEAFAHAWNAGDADAIADLFAEDADFVNVVGLWWTRRRQIRVNHELGFRWMFPESRFELDRVRVRDLGDVATVHAPWSMTGQTAPDGGEGGPRTGVLLFVVRRTAGGTWEAVAAQNTDRVPDAQTHLNDEEGGLAAVHYHPAAWRGRDDDPDDDGPEAC